MNAPFQVKMIGVGSAGCRTLDRLVHEWQDCPPALAMHTRANALVPVAGMDVLCLGESVTKGMSTGGEPDIGLQAAEASLPEIQRALQDVQLVLLIAGLGGGTGSGAAPLLAKTARESGVSTLAFCTLPFFFEGPLRRRVAETSLAEIRRYADAVILFPNQRMLKLDESNQEIRPVFDKVRDLMASSLRGLWKLLSQPGVINLDFADLKQMVKTSGGILAMAQAEASGPDRARSVVEKLAASPFLEHSAVIGSSAAILTGILGGPDLTLEEVQTVVTGVSVLARSDIELHYGAAVDLESSGRLQVILLAAEQIQSFDETPPEGASVERPPQSIQGETGLVQVELNLIGKKGRFVDTESTVYNGQDLDEPTFIRRGLRLSCKP